MTTVESARKPEDVTEGLETSVRKGFWIDLVWAIGLISTIYLVGHASFLAFLAVVFGSPSSIGLFGYLGSIALDSTPMCCYAATGGIGLKFWPSRRFWMLGLSAISAETALAVYAFANPGSIPMFTNWLL